MMSINDDIYEVEAEQESFFCRKYNMPPGIYIFYFDQETCSFVFKQDKHTNPLIVLVPLKDLDRIIEDAVLRQQEKTTEYRKLSKQANYASKRSTHLEQDEKEISVGTINYKLQLEIEKSTGDIKGFMLREPHHVADRHIHVYYKNGQEHQHIKMNNSKHTDQKC